MIRVHTRFPNLNLFSQKNEHYCVVLFCLLNIIVDHAVCSVHTEHTTRTQQSFMRGCSVCSDDLAAENENIESFVSCFSFLRFVSVIGWNN